MKNEFQKLLVHLADHENLTREQSQRAFQIIMLDGATPAQMGAFLMAMRVKGETVDELVGGAEVLRVKSHKISAPENALDTCGTGGDGQNTLNISTAAAIVVAACGVPVAKHGNRAVTSLSGSSDVLAQLGVKIDAEDAIIERCLRETNFCFMLATKFHPGLRHIAPVRQELQLRTIFNLIGPISNPAGVKRQLLGVYHERWVEPMAMVLKELGSTQAWVVHGQDGTDELSIAGPTHVAELKDGLIHRFTVTPEDAGLEPSPLSAIHGGDAPTNAHAITALLAKTPSPYRDAVLLNASAALLVAGKVSNLQLGVAMAAEAIDSGHARETLARLVALSNEVMPHE